VYLCVYLYVCKSLRAGVLFFNICHFYCVPFFKTLFNCLNSSKTLMVFMFAFVYSTSCYSSTDLLSFYLHVSHCFCLFLLFSFEQIIIINFHQIKPCTYCFTPHTLIIPQSTKRCFVAYVTMSQSFIPESLRSRTLY
jgi:hypothetical protein